MCECLLADFQNWISFLKHIITPDQTWVHHSIPELKQASKERKNGKPSLVKAEWRLLAGKVMAIVYLDRHGLLYIDFLHGKVLSEVMLANRRKRRDFCDSSPRQSHTAAMNQQNLQKFDWKILNQPFSSSDLSPCDVHVLGTIKENLGVQSSNVYAEVEAHVPMWICLFAGKNTFWKEENI